MSDKILKELEDTELFEKIKTVEKLYKKLEKKQKTFCNEFDIHCINGCGKCCENFTPDINEAEALFLAYGLIKEGKDDLVLEMLNNKTELDNYCPLYIKESDHHCLVYKWRPLICRLFGAAASKDKNQEFTFRKCKWNEIGRDISKDEFNKDKKHVVLMSDYGEALNEICPTNQNRLLIKEALEDALNKIKYIMELERESKVK